MTDDEILWSERPNVKTCKKRIRIEIIIYSILIPLFISLSLLFLVNGLFFTIPIIIGYFGSIFLYIIYRLKKFHNFYVNLKLDGYHYELSQTTLILYNYKSIQDIFKAIGYKPFYLEKNKCIKIERSEESTKYIIDLKGISYYKIISQEHKRYDVKITLGDPDSPIPPVILRGITQKEFLDNLFQDQGIVKIEYVKGTPNRVKESITKEEILWSVKSQDSYYLKDIKLSGLVTYNLIIIFGMTYLLGVWSGEMDLYRPFMVLGMSIVASIITYGYFSLKLKGIKNFIETKSDFLLTPTEFIFQNHRALRYNDTISGKNISELNKSRFIEVQRDGKLGLIKVKLQKLKGYRKKRSEQNPDVLILSFYDEEIGLKVNFPVRGILDTSKLERQLKNNRIEERNRIDYL